MLSASTPSSNNESNRDLSYYLSRASGWFNPFNYLPGRSARVITASLIFMQQVSGANALTCFKGKPTDIFKLDCLHGIDPSIYALFKDACGGLIKDVDCYSRGNSNLWRFPLGSSFFDGTVCDFYYNTEASSNTVVCLLDAIRSHIPSGLYGSERDIGVTAGICIGGITVLAVAGAGIYGCYRFFKSRKQHAEVRDPLEELEESDDSPEKRFEALKQSIAVLKENGVDDVRLSKLETEMKAFEEEYRDPIELSIMSRPYQINCEGKHTFEFTNINQCDEGQGCPCCRGAFNKNAMTRNEIMEKMISHKLVDFVERLEMLRPASEWEMTAVRIGPS